MHIQDFYSRFIAAEESRLFQALRTLSRVDPKSLTDQPGIFNSQWVEWPPAAEAAAPAVA